MGEEEEGRGTHGEDGEDGEEEGEGTLAGNVEESMEWGGHKVAEMQSAGWTSQSEGLESYDDRLRESMLSPELPAGGERGPSFTGELTAIESGPKSSRLSLFTMLWQAFGEVGVLSATASISQDRA